jgi:head-tail adaptor
MVNQSFHQAVTRQAFQMTTCIIERPSGGTSTSGEPLDAWTVVDTVLAYVEQTPKRAEVQQTGQVVSLIQTTLHFDTSLTILPTYRFKVGSSQTVYYVSQVGNDNATFKATLSVLVERRDP